jgi:bifunctional UDP-N-acetylglucosamine pyrophosphorylase/glucosamine-1-phosphate N-acetyltransferase
MSVIEVKDPRGLGMVEVAEGRVVNIYEKTEKPPTLMANAGLYLFTPAIFEAIARTEKSPRGEYEITDSLLLLMDTPDGLRYQELKSWLDLSYPWDLLSANETMLAGLEAENLGEVEDNVVLKGAVAIGRNTVVKSGAYIVGPVVIGEDCEIGPNCYIRPSTAIGDGCHIGAAVEVKNSIIMKCTKIPHHNYVGDSVIGEGCNFGSGTKIANLRLDKNDIRVAGIDTKRRKLGAIIGDHVETGINASINVGSMIGNNTFIGPGIVVSGVILPNSKIF